MQAEIRKILGRYTRGLFLTRAVESSILFAAIAVALCGLVMLISLVMQLGLPFSLWILPALAIPIGAFAGVVFSLLRGTTTREAAVFLDARYKLQEKLATAAELMEEENESPAGLCVYSQTIIASERIPPWPNFRKSPPAITTALILGVMFCGVLSLIPRGEQKSPLDEADNIKQIVAAMNEISPTVRDELAKAIKEAPTRDEKIISKLNSLARAIIAKDQAEQQRILAALARAGYRPIASLPENLRRELTQAGAGKISSTPPQDESPNKRAIPGSKLFAEPHLVRIYHPDYVDISNRPLEETQNTSYQLSLDAPPDLEWFAAKARAAQKARTPSENPPPNYRPIIRRFYNKNKQK